jgi:hypothetical protein
MTRPKRNFGVMPGLVPGIPFHVAMLSTNLRDCRDKPGNDDD